MKTVTVRELKAHWAQIEAKVKAGSPRHCLDERRPQGIRHRPRPTRIPLMLSLDTSAFIKLYLREAGSEEVHRLAASQADPLPVWYLTEVELANAVKSKVFLAEMKPGEAEGIVRRYLDRKAAGQHFAPALDLAAFRICRSA